MFPSRRRLARALSVGLLSILSLSVTNCGKTLVKPAAPASRVAVGTKDLLYVAVPVLSDTALAALTALGWGEGRFQTELRNELAYQFRQKKVRLTEDSASARAWLAVRVEAYEIGRDESRYLGDAGLKTAKGERRIAFRKTMDSYRDAERANPTVDHIRQIAENLASEARKAPASTAKTEIPFNVIVPF